MVLMDQAGGQVSQRVHVWDGLEGGIKRMDSMRVLIVWGGGQRHVSSDAHGA